MDGKKHQNVDFEGKLSLGLGFSLLNKRNYFLSGFIVFKYSFLKKKIDLFLAALGLHCYAQAFHSCIEWEFLVLVPKLLIMAVSLVQSTGSRP